MVIWTILLSKENLGHWSASKCGIRILFFRNSLCSLDEFPISPSDSGMMRILKIIFISLFVIANGFASERPNVLLVMADDMGYSDIGCFGGEIRTPHLDSLANEGIRFTNFYSENMCWVSRASMLTGVYHRTSIKDGALHPSCLTLAEALKSEGYRTGIMGKWHLGDYPDSRGFDQFYGILGGASSFFAPFGLKRNRNSIDHEFMDDPDYYFTQAIGKEAIAFLRETSSEDPFFLYLPFTAAHWPLHAPAAAIEKYHGKFAAGWDNLRIQRLKRMKELGVIDSKVVLSPRNPKVPAWKNEPNKAWQERRMEVYAAQVTAMDEVIGKIIDHLRKSGKLENTLTFFTVDNGGCHIEYQPDRKGDYLPEKTRDGQPMKPGNLSDIMPGSEITYQSYGHGWANLSNTPFRLFKQYDHEGGIRTPMIAHWPRRIKESGKISKTLSHLVDLMPSILHATRGKSAEKFQGSPRITLDGRSILPSLLGKKQKDPAFLFFHHARGKAIRYGKWKLVFNRDGKKNSRWELYDLEKDPTELNDLSTTYPERVKRLSSLWNEWEKNQVYRSSQ